MDKALAESNGDIEKLQSFFSTKGWVGQKLYRIDAKSPLNYNPRVPHRGLSGANEHFIEGGSTGGGLTEIVTDLLPKDETMFTNLN